MHEHKRKFIEEEIWMLTINASFQRANVYEQKSTEKQRRIFRSDLKQFIEGVSKGYKSAPHNEDKHLFNIKSIIYFSRKYKDILQNGALSFGVSQKLLNLYLKYLWTLDIISCPPPHFPVDRIIQEKMKIRTPALWTDKNFSEKDYFMIIQLAYKLCADKYQTIAEWELVNYGRRTIDITI